MARLRGVRGFDADGGVVCEWPGLVAVAGDRVQLPVSAGRQGRSPAVVRHFVVEDASPGRDGWVRAVADPAEGRVTAAVRRAGERHARALGKAAR